MLISGSSALLRRVATAPLLARSAPLSASFADASASSLLLAAGNLQPSSRTLILNAIQQLPQTRPADRARLAIYLTLTSPEAAIMR
jgi:hypothetical protein